MPDSIKCLQDVYEKCNRVTAWIHVVGDILDIIAELMAAVVPLSETVLKVERMWFGMNAD